MSFELLNQKPAAKLTPIYLIIAEDPTLKPTRVKYLAIRLDEQRVHSIEFVGIDVTDKNIEDLAQNYQTVLQCADKATFKEMQIGWSRIISITNLTYAIKKATSAPSTDRA